MFKQFQNPFIPGFENDFQKSNYHPNSSIHKLGRYNKDANVRILLNVLINPFNSSSLNFTDLKILFDFEQIGSI